VNNVDERLGNQVSLVYLIKSSLSDIDSSKFVRYNQNHPFYCVYRMISLYNILLS